jgi:hypothetical protein
MFSAFIDALGKGKKSFDDGGIVSCTCQVHSVFEIFLKRCWECGDSFANLSPGFIELLSTNLWVFLNCLAPIRTHLIVDFSRLLGYFCVSGELELDELVGLSLSEAKFFEDGGGTFDGFGVELSPIRRGELVFVWSANGRSGG